MDDSLDEMIVAVRADTRGFAQDMATMRNSFDATLVDGFSSAGNVLERSLLSALRKGSLGFDDLKRVAFAALDQIAAQALKSGLGSLFGRSGSGSGIGDVVGSVLGGLLGLPGRATGGIVAPERPYLVGERGPELFVPTSAGRVLPNPGTPDSRNVNISINLAAPAGTNVPVALRRSGRQMASAVRRALSA